MNDISWLHVLWVVPVIVSIAVVILLAMLKAPTEYDEDDENDIGPLG